jgi:hypothetical protein
VLQSDHEHAAGDNAARRTARADAAAKTGRRLEYEVVFHIEQLLPRADNSLRSIKELVHVAFDALAYLFLNFFFFHRLVAPFEISMPFSISCGGVV